MEKKSKPTFYVTTPIYYVNDVPHIGHAYTTIIADALARHNRLAGREVFFLTGTDEHGQKIEKAAAERGITPLELADSVVTRAQDLWKALDISHDFFIRTTMPIHEQGVQKLFQGLLDKGDIYKGEYKGWYCVSDEAFLPADAPAGKDGAKICPDCGRPAVVVSEETYFFRLSAYQQRLLDHYEAHPQFVRPQSRMNEVVELRPLGAARPEHHPDDGQVGHCPCPAIPPTPSTSGSTPSITTSPAWAGTGTWSATTSSGRPRCISWARTSSASMPSTGRPS